MELLVLTNHKRKSILTICPSPSNPKEHQLGYWQGKKDKIFNDAIVIFKIKLKTKTKTK